MQLRKRFLCVRCVAVALPHKIGAHEILVDRQFHSVVGVLDGIGSLRHRTAIRLVCDLKEAGAAERDAALNAAPHIIGDLLLRVLRTRGFCLTIFPARRNWLVAAILKLLVDIIQLFNIAVEIAERLMQRAIKAVHLAGCVVPVDDGIQLVEKRNTIRFVGRQAVKSTVLSDVLHKGFAGWCLFIKVFRFAANEVEVGLVSNLLHNVGRFVRGDHTALFFGDRFSHIDLAAAGKRRRFTIPFAVRNDKRFNAAIGKRAGFCFCNASVRRCYALAYSVSSSKMTNFSHAFFRSSR